MQQGQNPLDQLRPNHLPDPIGFWPPATGWWILAGVILALVTALGYLAIRYWRKNHYRKLASKKAAGLLENYQQHENPRKFAHDCNRLLKQVALHAYPDQEVASLYGQPWREFLAETGNNPDFLNEKAEALGESRFNPERTPDITELHSLTLNWIRKHHV